MVCKACDKPMTESEMWADEELCSVCLSVVYKDLDEFKEDLKEKKKHE